MRIIRDYKHCPQEARRAVVALGNFDGVHRGHQAVIANAIAIAKKQGKPSAVMTFEPHPRAVLFPDTPPFRIFSFRQKVEKIRTMGVGFLFVVHFTPSFSKLTGEDFIQMVLMKHLGVSHLVIGHDFIFGHKRSGNATLLEVYEEKAAFALTHVKPVTEEKLTFSSTQIRERLRQGDIAGARSMLGHAYTIEGRVVRGENRGKSLGYPTANIRLKNLLTPALGIYIGQVRIDQTWHQAAVSIGLNPTFGGTKPVLEAYLLNFKDDLYGKRITVRIHQFLRPEQKFDTIENLKVQIAHDCEEVRRYFEGVTL